MKFDQPVERPVLRFPCYVFLGAVWWYSHVPSGEGTPGWMDLCLTKSGSSGSGTTNTAVVTLWFLVQSGRVFFLIPSFHMCLFEFIFVYDLKSEFPKFVSSKLLPVIWKGHLYEFPFLKRIHFLHGIH